MKPLKILNVVGARPNFMKMAPIIEAIKRYPAQIEQQLLHTGQHYDEKMSQAFFVDLGMPRPDMDLGVGSGTHAEQTAKIMVGFEGICVREEPDLVIVVGDVNSTLACTITAKKLGIRVAHVEAGLRSRDMSMPEEINRLCTDVLCDYLFTTDHLAEQNLLAEGIDRDKIFFVGNVMIDTLLKHKKIAADLDLSQRLGVQPRKYATLTLHRPSNVDNPAVLEGILAAVAHIAKDLPVIFPIHPRTRKMARQFGLEHYFNTGEKVEGVWITTPLGYLEFLHLNMNARLVLTDSGGLQEETTVLGVPCVTLRTNTERPITCEKGTNVLAGNKKEEILRLAEHILTTDAVSGQVPERWDGKAAQRIVETLLKIHSGAL